MADRRLLDKIAIVTGASSGIGRETALALAAEGAHMALAARRADLLQALAQEIESMGREALVVPTDVTERDQVDHLVTETMARWGRVDILVANAGQYFRCQVCNLTVDQIERAMAVNFYGSVYAILAVLPAMRAQNSGSLVLVTSLDGKVGIPPDAPYVAAKYALTGFGEVLRKELHGTGIHATVVLPGRVDTPLIDTLRVPWVSAKLAPQDVARAIVRAVHRGSPEVIIPTTGRALVILSSLSPRTADWLVRVLHLEGWEEAPLGEAANAS
jgi:NADP-dependent 3-hydroxy acid dehydrogenase YdfG